MTKAAVFLPLQIFKKGLAPPFCNGVWHLLVHWHQRVSVTKTQGLLGVPPTAPPPPPDKEDSAWGSKGVNVRCAQMLQLCKGVHVQCGRTGWVSPHTHRFP